MIIVVLILMPSTLIFVPTCFVKGENNRIQLSIVLFFDLLLTTFKISLNEFAHCSSLTFKTGCRLGNIGCTDAVCFCCFVCLQRSVCVIFFVAELFSLLLFSVYLSFTCGEQINNWTSINELIFVCLFVWNETYKLFIFEAVYVHVVIVSVTHQQLRSLLIMKLESLISSKILYNF